MFALQEISDYVGFLGSKAFYFFYENSFSKETSRRYIKKYVKTVLNLWKIYSIPVGDSLDNQHYFVPEIVISENVVKDLGYLFALDIKKQDKRLVLHSPFDVLRLAEIVDKVVKNRADQLADIYNIVLPATFIKVFDNKDKYGLKNYIPILSSDLYRILLNVTYNLANGMAILGEINKKYWDDSYLELSIAGFVLEMYNYLINEFLNLKNFQMVLDYFADAELIDLLDMRSSTDLSIKFSKNKFKTSLLYSKLRQTQQILDTIKNEYEKQVQKIIK